MSIFLDVFVVNVLILPPKFLVSMKKKDGQTDRLLFLDFTTCTYYLLLMVGLFYCLTPLEFYFLFFSPQLKLSHLESLKRSNLYTGVSLPFSLQHKKP